MVNLMVDFNAAKNQLVSFDTSSNFGDVDVKKLMGLFSLLNWTGAVTLKMKMELERKWKLKMKMEALIRSMKFLSSDVAIYL